MLKLYTGSNLYSLAEALLQERYTAPAKNLLSPELFIVQNYGMARWLSLYIAEKEGVAANLQFKFPAEVFWQIIRVMDSSVPQTLPSERGPMVWALMQILKHGSDSVFLPLHQYINNEDVNSREVRRWQLAKRIANVFDQYLTYRSDMLLNWQQLGQNQLQSLSQNERWQAVLWQKLVDHWENHSGAEWNHRAELQEQLIKSIENETLDGEHLPQQISVFGVSSMPPVYINMLVKLSELSDISFFTMAGETDLDHPLTKSMGMSGREYRLLLDRAIKEEGVAAKKINLEINNEPASLGLLNAFKAELLKSDTGPSKPSADGTIQVHSCHSRRREVEVLRDQLLAMMDKDETLQASDILVMAPDLAPYAPEIETIFGAAVEESIPDIPYYLSERGGNFNTIIDCFITLTELVESRFKVTDVLDFIQCGPVKETFGFTDENLSTIEAWIGENKVRWGIDGEHKSSLDLPEADIFTWQSGLNRMLLGYAMNPDEDLLYKEIYPYSEISRSEAADLAGRFSRLMHTLFKAHRQVKEPKTASAWADLLLEWSTVFFTDANTYQNVLQRLRNTFQELSNHAQMVSFDDTVSFQIIRSWLNDVLKTGRSGGGGSGGGITFSSLVPMRNIPARVICVLGMNDDAFPASITTLPFDLMKKNPRIGDRIHSRDDRQLFLETILSARDRLYFSYIGKSNRQDSDYPPSVVLRECIDFLTGRFDLEETDLITEHRLQAFSPIYFQPDTNQNLFSYSQKNKAIAARLASHQIVESGFLDKVLPPPDESYKRLTINQLVKFFTHPAKFLLQNRFGIYLREEELLDEDREAFDLGGLDGYHLEQELLERYLKGSTIASYQAVAFSKGMLPYGWPGEQAFVQKAEKVQKFGSHLEQALSPEDLHSVEIALDIGEFKVVGRLKNINEKGQAFYRFGSARSKDLIALWIKHLLFQTIKPEGHSGRSQLYTTDSKNPIAILELQALSKSKDILQDLLDIYWAGLQKNILFFPNTSFAYAKAIIAEQKDEKSALKKASNNWKNDYKSYGLDGEDVYNNLMIGNANPLEEKDLVDRFKLLSMQFWQPFFNALKKEDE